MSRSVSQRGDKGVSWANAMLEQVSRYRVYPTAAQGVLLLEQCAHARYVWNLGLEQRLMWRPWQGPTPGFAAQAAQLTEVRAAEPWLAAGSQTVQQQALRDLDQAWRNFFGRRGARRGCTRGSASSGRRRCG